MAFHHLLQHSPAVRLFEQAREELVSHMLRSGITTAPAERQREWLAETLVYLAERYPALHSTSLEELQGVGERYVDAGG
jgi:hypothetical protein